MSRQSDVTGSLVFGLIFITVGVLVLLHEFDVLTLSWSYVLPIVLIVAGVAVIIATQVNAYMNQE